MTNQTIKIRALEKMMLKKTRKRRQKMKLRLNKKEQILYIFSKS